MRGALLIVVIAACGFEGKTPSPGAGIDAPAPADAIDASPDAFVLGAWGTPQLVTELNSTAIDDDPTLTSDLLEIYFGSNRGGGGEDIYRATRTSAALPFGPPELVAELSSASADSNVDIVGDGLTILFTSTRNGQADLWYATRATRSSAWTTPQPAADLNSNSAEWGAFMTEDRLSVVLCSTRSGLDEALFAATRASTETPFPAAIELATLESPSDECDAMLPTATTIYFTSTRPGGAGGLDLYMATRAGGDFEQLVNIAALNTVHKDSDPWVSADQRTMYFSSDRLGAFTDDIYVSTR